jgi:hypothetical protein
MDAWSCEVRRLDLPLPVSSYMISHETWKRPFSVSSRDIHGSQSIRNETFNTTPRSYESMLNVNVITLDPLAHR